MITRESWPRVRPIVEGALALPPEQVPEYLDRACGGDVEIRRLTEELLRAAESAGSAMRYLDGSAAELAAPLLELERLAAVAESDLAPGMALGNYTVERMLGSGGTGVVYLAQDRRLGRKVALKLLPPWLPASDSANRRFVEEAQAASALDHPNIQTIYEVGERADGQLFIAMAHYDGETLQERIARGPLSVSVAVDLGRQIAAGLSAAHTEGIVHRDIKPGNVMVTRRGVAKILDFGAATLSSRQHGASGVLQGTIAYMSPEQTRTPAVDARADLWALGVVLYEMLTGERPFGGEGAEAVIQSIRHEEPEPVERRRREIPEALAEIVRRCLAKDPAQRYQTAEDLRQDLERLPTSSRSRPGVRVAAAVAVAVALSLPLLLLSGTRRPPVLPQAATIAVLPLVSVSGDSALTRLGRELAVTISANLEGLGGIRTVPATTVLVHTGTRTLSLAEAARLASRLGASSFLHGTVVGSGGVARLDLSLVDPDGLRTLVQASVAGAAEDIGALTDSATIELARRIWSREAPPAPNLAAITTRSVPALRAYLEGELALVRSNYDVAVSAFERAYAADPTFALAYWRSLYPRIYEGSTPDPSIVAQIVAHRDRLPNAEALMVDAYVAPTLSEKLDILRTVTARYPGYWPGWYAYADRLVHDGPYIGSTYADARRALERVVELNPDFASGWLHLHWIVSLQRDTVAVHRTVENLERLAVADGWVNTANMVLTQAFQEMFRSGGELSAELAERLASGEPQMVPGLNRSVLLFMYGFPAGQLRQIDAVLRSNPPREVAAAQWAGRAFTWAGRGAWDSAFVALEQWVRLSMEPRTALTAYGLAVLGVTTGAVEAGRAARWRPTSVPPVANSADWLAERAWLDGILAYAERDGMGLVESTRELATGGATHADLLVSSLLAFQQDAAGGRSQAARALLALELAASERGDHRRAALSHPYLAAIHRPAAARWLLEGGDTVQALTLLSWHEAILADGPVFTGRNAANRVVEPLALYERARIEEAWGWQGPALEHYRTLLARYDRPPAHQAAIVEESYAAALRLAGGGTSPQWPTSSTSRE